MPRIGEGNFCSGSSTWSRRWQWSDVKSRVKTVTWLGSQQSHECNFGHLKQRRNGSTKHAPNWKTTRGMMVIDGPNVRLGLEASLSSSPCNLCSRKSRDPRGPRGNTWAWAPGLESTWEMSHPWNRCCLGPRSLCFQKHVAKMGPESSGAGLTNSKASHGLESSQINLDHLSPVVWFLYLPSHSTRKNHGKWRVCRVFR